jgi:hypothetical protein
LTSQWAIMQGFQMPELLQGIGEELTQELKKYEEI